MSVNLIESKRASQKSVRGTIVSIAIHATIITLAVIATARAGEVRRPAAETITPIYAPRSDRSTAPHTKPTTAHPAPRTPTVPRESPRLPSIDISKTLQPIDPTTSMPSPESLFPTHTGGTGAATTMVGTGGDSGAPCSQSQVEKPAIPRGGNPSPRYPSMLESSRVEGTVLAQFVVDTIGRADMSTFRVLESSNDLFSASLRSALEQWRFYPAEAGGHKVKQIVQLPLKFVAPSH